MEKFPWFKATDIHHPVDQGKGWMTSAHSSHVEWYSVFLLHHEHSNLQPLHTHYKKPPSLVPRFLECGSLGTRLPTWVCRLFSPALHSSLYLEPQNMCHHALQLHKTENISYTQCTAAVHWANLFLSVTGDRRQGGKLRIALTQQMNLETSNTLTNFGFAFISRNTLVRLYCPC